MLPTFALLALLNTACASSEVTCSDWAISSDFTDVQAEWIEQAADVWNVAAKHPVIRTVRADRSSCIIVPSGSGDETHAGALGVDRDVISLYRPVLTDNARMWRIATAHEFGHVLLGPEHLPPPAVMSALVSRTADAVLQPNDLAHCRDAGICPP